MDDVTVFGCLPESLPSRAIEGLLQGTTVARGGAWEVHIRHVPQTPWSLLRIKHSPDGFKCTVLLDPRGEPLAQVAAGLGDAVRHQGRA